MIPVDGRDERVRMNDSSGNYATNQEAQKQPRISCVTEDEIPEKKMCKNRKASLFSRSRKKEGFLSPWQPSQLIFAKAFNKPGLE